MTRQVPAPESIEWMVQDGRGHRTATVESTVDFHRRLPGYAATPLVCVPGVAADLGVAEIWIKDESNRIGLPSFKILGASWAAYCALRSAGGFADDDWTDLSDLSELVATMTGVARLAAATDGNHGRAVAHVARLLGLEASIFVPQGTAEARIAAIASEGASVKIVSGGYEDAVNRAAREASEDCLVISDTSWEGYETVPRTVIEGYSTIFEEADRQLAEVGGDRSFDVVIVQAGVGALAAAAARWYRSESTDVRLVCVEPLSSACNLASMLCGEIVSIPGPHSSIMVGLNCDTPSLVAWPDVSAGFDAFIAIEDEAARRAMRRLATEDIVSGETGSAGLAGLTEICAGAAAAVGRELALGADSRILVVSTEGATDLAAYAEIVGVIAD